VAAKGLYLHIGLPKTGTTFLQSLLAENRPRLREAGFIYPFVRKEGMFHAAVEVRGDHERWGLDPVVIEGSWQALIDKAEAFDGTAVISHEILAGATTQQVERVGASLRGVDLHLVVTARDPARQVVAHWQEAVKNGQTFSFADFTREVLREDGAPDSELWNEQDLLGVLDRWGAVVPPDHLHLVPCPPDGADRELLWQRFADATGVPVGLTVTEEGRANESLGLAQVHLLRRVNAELDGRIAQPTYAHVVKRYFAQRVLSEMSGERPVAPESLREPLTELARTWVEEVSRRGYTVHGDLSDLVPTRFGDKHPDDVGEPSDIPPVALAALLERIAELRLKLETAPALQPSRRIRRKLWEYKS